MTKSEMKIITGTLLLLLFAGEMLSAGENFHFTVTADPRGNHSTFGNVCQSINAACGGPGAFHISVGDVDNHIWENRAVIDACFGAQAIWYPVIGNHEKEAGAEMEWLRNEYDNGNNIRTPLKNYTNQNGPAGTKRTNYSWDYGNAHFIVLNEYWDGATNEGVSKNTSGSDTAIDGDVVPALYDWLAADLEACSKPFIFVFGHEPAFAYHRHVGGSLDAHKADRDAFWNLLETKGVTAYICGHTHYFSAHPGDANHIGSVWQFDAGNAGNDEGDGQTFFDVILDVNHATVNVYRKKPAGAFTRTNSFQLTPGTCRGTFKPAKYKPQESVLVSLIVKPDVATEQYEVKDTPPPAWMISSVNYAGTWDDSNKKVRWGPFSDNLQRNFSYIALPPQDNTLSQRFVATTIVNGVNMIYQRFIPPAQGRFGSFENLKNIPSEIIDGNGTVVSFNLTGAGWGEIADVNFSRIILYETTDKSIFTVRTKGLQDTTIGDVIADGPMKGINAKTTNLSGRIEIGSSSNPKSNVTIVFDQAFNQMINSQIPIKTLTATEWLGGSINAPSAGILTIKGDAKRGILGDLCGVDLNFSGGSDEKMPALGKLVVRGWIDSCRISSRGNIGAIAAGGIANTSCFAGITNVTDSTLDGVWDLPSARAANFDESAVIKSIRIKGIKGEQFCVINSNIAAAQILNASLSYPQTDNGGVPFGLTAGFIKSLKIKFPQGSQSWRNLDKPDDSQVFGNAQILLY